MARARWRQLREAPRNSMATQPHTTTMCMHLRAPPCTCAHLRAGQPLGGGLRGTRQAGHRPLRGRGGHAAFRVVCGRGRCGRASMIERPRLGLPDLL